MTGGGPSGETHDLLIQIGHLSHTFHAFQLLASRFWPYFWISGVVLRILWCDFGCKRVCQDGKIELVPRRPLPPEVVGLVQLS